jgi:hypothetical protein
MRYIHILPDIITRPLPTPAGLAPMTLHFVDVVIDSWLANDEHFGKGLPAIRSAAKIEKLFATAEIGAWVPVEDTDYDRLRKVAETADYKAVFGRYLLPFVEAVVLAPSEPPPS